LRIKPENRKITCFLFYLSLLLVAKRLVYLLLNGHKYLSGRNYEFTIW